MGTLYLVSTPIGNLSDITLRAIDTLKSVDFIACEDTRHSLKLLNHYEIKKPLISYHKFNENEKSEVIISHLDEGKSVALISDAGSPVISDPGSIIIATARAKGHNVSVVPGASAVTAAATLAGISGGFIFIGFLPVKAKSRAKLLDSYMKSPLPLVLYSAPHDIKRDLEDIYAALGGRRYTVVKELTKIHERVSEGILPDIIVENPKGEYVLIIMPSEEEEKIDLTEREQVIALIKEGMSKKEAVKETARSRGVNKNRVYMAVTDIKD